MKSMKFNYVNDSCLNFMNIMLKRQGGRIEKIYMEWVVTSGNLFKLLENTIGLCRIKDLNMNKVMSTKEWLLLAKISSYASKWVFCNIDDQIEAAQEELALIIRRWLEQFPKNDRPKCDRSGRVIGNWAYI